MASATIIDQIRQTGRSLAWVAREIGVERTLLDKKLRGTRRPLTETQARHLRALIGMTVSLDQIPHIPDAPTKDVA